ncbi:hypothetical protein J7394_22285 [Ruegeria sp. R13_0]|uniref:hypothetical protein n=1 Tax=Ruegeria sp. R13_0 TaxID=2821099 RepID=UPI001ADAB755|nr:hypothetical protein [Ruegeria sp. R13_0]MBO9436942.1 hypothetical protein [Ruegeria sp. R13_0]
MKTQLHALTILGILTGTAGFAEESASVAQYEKTMFFADRYATAYYSVDEAASVVTITILQGPDGVGQPMRIESQLKDGETTSFAITGTDGNALTATLFLSRLGNGISAVVKTQIHDERNS